MSKVLGNSAVEATTMNHVRRFLWSSEELMRLDRRLRPVHVTASDVFYVGDKPYEMYGFLQPYILEVVKALVNPVKVAYMGITVDYMEHNEALKKASIRVGRPYAGNKRYKYMRMEDVFEKYGVAESRVYITPFILHDFIYIGDLRIPNLYLFKPVFSRFANDYDIVWVYEDESFYKLIYMVVVKNTELNRFFDIVLHEVENVLYSKSFSIDLSDRILIYHHIYRVLFSLSIHVKNNGLGFLDYYYTTTFDALCDRKYIFDDSFATPLYANRREYNDSIIASMVRSKSSVFARML